MGISLKKDSLLVCWFFLLISIVLEVVGTSLLKYSQLYWGFNGVPITVGLLCLYYLTLSRALFRVPIGVAYAIWEGVGLSLIVGISVLLLGESLTPARIVGLSCVFLGSVLIHRGTESSPQKTEK